MNAKLIEYRWTCLWLGITQEKKMERKRFDSLYLVSRLVIHLREKKETESQNMQDISLAENQTYI